MKKFIKTLAVIVFFMSALWLDSASMIPTYICLIAGLFVTYFTLTNQY